MPPIEGSVGARKETGLNHKFQWQRWYQEKTEWNKREWKYKYIYKKRNKNEIMATVTEYASIPAIQGSSLSVPSHKLIWEQNILREKHQKEKEKKRGWLSLKKKKKNLWIRGVPFAIFVWFKRSFEETKNRKMKCVENNQFVIDRSISPYHRTISWNPKVSLISFKRGLTASHPRMLQDFRDGDSTVHISIEHSPDQMDATVGKRKERDSKWMIQYLVDVVEWVFFINNGV